MATGSLFLPVGDRQVQATELARGPWSPGALHGGPVAALLAGAAEAHLAEGQAPSRLTLELRRPVPLTPLVVAAGVIRPGRKVSLVEATLALPDGTVVATAVLLGIRRAPVAIPEHPRAAPLPPPDSVPPTDPASGVDEPSLHDYRAFHNAGVEHRFVRGRFIDPGPATDWIRLRVPVLGDEAVTPLQRVAAAADFGNGVSGVAPFTELRYLNPDLTIHLHRLPVGEWVAIDAVTVLEPDGVGLAQSELHDERGVLGRSLQSLIVEAP